MNILMVTPDYPPVFGGIGTHVYELCNQLNGKGLHITIALFRLGRNPLIDQITYGQSVTHSVISEDIDFLEVDTTACDQADALIKAYPHYFSLREYEDIKIGQLNYLSFIEFIKDMINQSYS